ncbi:MAG: hypothetical protein A4E28_02256 [Methanocella sp. PtaU1.Bin125]|nr:MAG: hypothetical protein A4E28_02256 [Methanocella sp. PtaU1.Bin125]
MEVVTYSLTDDAPTSDQYYRDVATFTGEVLGKAKDLAPIVAAYRAWVKETGREAARSEDEYAFELLMLGTLWRTYADDALDVPGRWAGVISALSRLRQQGGVVKAAADGLRGVLATIFLAPSDRDWRPKATLEHFDGLMRWMDATGDYVQEVRRMRGWRAYWAGQPGTAVAADIDVAIGFAAWFEGRSLTALGRYTPNVEKFLREKQPAHRWKEDVIFSARRRVEYHLNMVGAEIMNRTFRADFRRTKHKAVILPACMRYYPKPQCKARSNGLSCECAECTPQCRVNQITKMGRKFGFSVHLVPHESSVFSGDAGKQLIGEGVGIVGVACVSSLVSGGWKAKGLGLPPQCVLLDHCGCRKHWHDQGIPTDINMSRLMQVLNIKREEAVPAAQTVGNCEVKR